MSKRKKFEQFVRGTGPLLVGQVVGRVIVRHARDDYKETKTPPFSPPGYVFPIVWSLLYTSMGIAHACVTYKKPSRFTSMTYMAQLAFNYAWAIIYFKFKWRGIAVINSFLLLGAVIVTTVQFFKKHKVAGVLLFPYVAWCTFAAYLATGNYLLNKA